MHQGRHEQRGIGGAACDHDLRAAGQRVADRADPEVGVGRNDALAQVRHRAAGLLQPVVVLAHLLKHVVAGDRRHLQPVQAELGGDGRSHARRRDRVGCAHVGDDADPVAHAQAQHRPHPRRQQRVEPALGVAALGLLGQRDGALGQAFEDQIVQRAMLDQLDRRLDPVARIAGA